MIAPVLCFLLASASTFSSVIASPAAAPVNVFWHVISKDGTPDGGNVLDSQIHQQISVLNAAFDPIGLSWRLAGVDRTVNSSWFSAGDDTPGQNQTRNALRQGGVADLNVYSLGSIDFKDRHGSGTYPWDYNANPTKDGVAVRYDALPGGNLATYNTGATLVHHVGHWVGLLHTYEGGCAAPGDFVDDTPPQLTWTDGCPLRRDSCAGGGLDPIHNYMDNSNDDCRNNFTPGQFARLSQQLAKYRGISLQ